jgi:peptide/nickel transport system permease protein
VIPVIVLLVVLIVPSILPALIAPYEPLAGDITNRLAAPSTEHWFGTDKIGRDILTRVIYGARVSVIVAGVAIAISGLIGTAFGIISAFYGGWWDNVMMRLVDISLSLPIIVVAIVVAAMAGPSMKILIAVLVLSQWSRYARLVRGETLTIRAQDYISRARVAGASNPRIMLRYIFPNIVNTIVVLATLQVGFVIVLEATLSFLGAGISRPTPAWGLMVADGRDLIATTSGWWVSFFPGLTIMLVVLSMNLLGDWLRDKLDPRQRQV